MRRPSAMPGSAHAAVRPTVQPCVVCVSVVVSSDPCALWWTRNDSRACAHLQARALAHSRPRTDSPRVQYAPNAGLCFPQRRACSRPRRLRSVNTSSALRTATRARPVLIGLQTQWYVRLRRSPRASRFGAPRQMPRTRRAATCGLARPEPEHHLQNLRLQDQHLRD
jgi:hypothetical protein